MSRNFEQNGTGVLILNLKLAFFWPTRFLYKRDLYYWCFQLLHLVLVIWRNSPTSSVHASTAPVVDLRMDGKFWELGVKTMLFVDLISPKLFDISISFFASPPLERLLTWKETFGENLKNQIFGTNFSLDTFRIFQHHSRIFWKNTFYSFFQKVVRYFFSLFCLPLEDFKRHFKKNLKKK